MRTDGPIRAGAQKVEVVDYIGPPIFKKAAPGLEPVESIHADHATTAIS